MSKVTLQGVSKSYGPVKAVTHVTLTIEQGQFVTLLGPSGSGKTTTMRMIAGLERPDDGIISIGDRVVSGPGTFVPTYKRRLGMVFQSYAVWPHKTVQENVVFPLQQRGISRTEQRQKVQQILDRVGLGHLSQRYPGQLSGGQQQRVSLARALVAEPDVILFDEPLSNLDVRLRDSMRDLLGELHKNISITSVYVTHDQAEAMVLSDRVYVMNEGKVVQSGTPKELYEHPNSIFVANFIGQANTLKIVDLDWAARTVTVEGGTRIGVTPFEGPVSENILIIRPNRIRFAQEGDSENVVEGFVRSVSNLGDHLRCQFSNDAGLSLMIDLVADGRSIDLGGPARVVLPREACIVI
jgi:ABC-type Fe3+/spermidine/putrescine transport system ATPase subunit